MSARLKRLKQWRTAEAARLSIDPALVWPARSLERLSRDPRVIAEEIDSPEVRRWQARGVRRGAADGGGGVGGGRGSPSSSLRANEPPRPAALSYSAGSPRSPLLTRTTSATWRMKILPSPISWPPGAARGLDDGLDHLLAHRVGYDRADDGLGDGGSGWPSGRCVRRTPRRRAGAPAPSRCSSRSPGTRRPPGPP